MGGRRPVVIVSNRGPLSFRIGEAGGLVATRGAGGLVSGLAPLVAGTDTTWIAAAISEGDRTAASRGVIEAEGFRVRTMAPDREAFRLSYDVVCNGALWFMHHGLWDLARRPRFDHHFATAWEAYRSVNEAFAAVVADEAPDGAAVLVQDYHLTLLAPAVRSARPDLRLVHFSHTPFAGPDLLRVLPVAVREELLAGLDAHDACGFHAQRWARNRVWSTEDVLGRAPRAPSFVSPLASDADDLRATAASDACARAMTELDQLVGDRAFVVRVDRIELSKNLLRGFHAYDDLLERYPTWRGRVVFGAFCYPSRDTLPEYRAYRQEVDGLVRRLNEKWGTPDWQPIVLDLDDDYPRSVAALRRYDVLLVNPIRDGLNLVALEGPTVNERDGTLVLSTEAGVWDVVGAAATPVDPYDVTATADAIHAALAASPRDRAERADALRQAATARAPRDWLDEQLAAAG